MNKILLTGNAIGPNQFGGVKNFITKFISSHSSNFNELQFFSFGSSPNWSFDKKGLSPLKYRAVLIWKLYQFIRILLNREISVVHHNSGMSSLSILRELPFIVFSLIFSKKRIIFFHGWNDSEFLRIRKKIF